MTCQCRPIYTGPFLQGNQTLESFKADVERNTKVEHCEPCKLLGSAIEWQKEHIATLEASRDELIKALEQICKRFERSAANQKLYEFAKSAIQRAKEAHE